MEPSIRRLTKRQQADLRGYVATGTAIFRAAAFLAAVAVVGLILRGLYRLVTTPATPSLVQQAWWGVPTLGFAAWLYRRAGGWTGGRAFRQKVRADLRGGVAVGRRVTAVDAIEIEEQEDEGPTFFLRTDDGRTMFFAGQYLERYQRKGFPWKAFDIFEAPESGLLMDIDAADERLVPSMRRGPLSWEHTKRLGLLRKRYGVIDVDFESLRSMA
jgi:hypothetical protein